MTDYIKIPSFPTRDLLRGIEAISPYPRINSQQPSQEGYAQQQPDSQQEQAERARRRFVSLRHLIDELQESAQITRVDFGTADTELRSLGLAIVEEQLLQQLLQLKVPLNSIEQLLLQIDQNRSNANLGTGRRINNDESPLFPVSVTGLSEYNFRIEDLKIHASQHSDRILGEIDERGLCVVEQNRLRLTFSRMGPALAARDEQLKLKVSALLAVIEVDEAERRAILYPRGDNSYGLYADKLINLSI